MFIGGNTECGKPLQTETTTRSQLPNGVKAIVKQILASEEIKK